MSSTPDSPAKMPDDRTTQGGNYWTLFTPEIWKLLHAVLHAIRAAGAKLFFLRPYSPDLNPIEQTFAKLKTLLRKAGERTINTTWRCVGTLLHEFFPTECANYVRNSGYVSV
jgi:transposase